MPLKIYANTVEPKRNPVKLEIDLLYSYACRVENITSNSIGIEIMARYLVLKLNL